MTESSASSSSRRAWVALGFAWLTLIVVLATWLSRTPAGALREQLKVLQFWSLEACVAAGLVVGVAVLPGLVKGLDGRDYVAMAFLSALALSVTLLVAPRTNRIYYDEQIYQGVGQNLADLRLAQMCNDGTVEYGRLQCWVGEYNKQPYAYPHLLSLAYRAVGVRPGVAFAVNAAAMATTACLLYILAFTLFGDRMAAFWGGLLLTLMPEQIKWSATAAVEPTASLACVGAMLAAAHFVRSRKTISLLAVAIASAYAVQFRPESTLILLPTAVLLFPVLFDEVKQPRLWWAALLFLALTSVHLGHSVAVRNEGWGTNDARLSFGYLVSNLRVNGWFYLADERFPVVITLLAAFAVGHRGRVPSRVALASYFLAFWGIDLLFYAGSYNYGADVRYSLMTYPPLALLGGFGASRLTAGLKGFAPRVPWRWAATAALLFQFLLYAPNVRATTEEAWAARADVRFAQSFAAELPPNAYVLTHNPGMFHLWHVNAGQISLVAGNPTYLDHLADRYGGGVYLHWNFWCNVADPLQAGFCKKVLDGIPSEPTREYEERGQRFVLYRLRPKPIRP